MWRKGEVSCADDNERERGGGRGLGGREIEREGGRENRGREFTGTVIQKKGPCT